MKPFETMVGVHKISLSLRRTVMLPSFAAAKPLLYSRRPISQICSLILNSDIAIVVAPQAKRVFEPRGLIIAHSKHPGCTHNTHRAVSCWDETASTLRRLR